MSAVQELYAPIVMAANATATVPQGRALGGFVCTVSGVLNATVDSVSVLTNFPVTAGNSYAFGFAISGSLAVVLSGGAAGTLLVG